MPLPAGTGLAWPPRELAAVRPRLAEWSAWYAGDPTGLANVYRTGSQVRVGTAQGVVGRVRTWWGGGRADLTKPRTQLHVPIAADLCQASADLLYSERPRITVGGTAADKARLRPTQDRIDVLLDDGLHNQLAEGAEVAAALGSNFLRVTWDREVAPAPFVTSVHADGAWPVFRYGRMVAVTFWRVVSADGTVVRRHLERHELVDGVGVVLHGLYEGREDDLGRAVPLVEDRATAGLAELVGPDGQSVSTESPGLAVVHVPNQTPQRRFRTDPVGMHYGRSDLDGVEGLMDALDETWSSWMRDLRLGKARVLVARSALEDLGAGRGAAFDTDREVFESLNVLASREASGLPIEPVQFAIRVEEHARTQQELVESILRSAGYSSRSFGESEQGGAVTAAEVQSQERRSFLTRDRKARLQRPAVAALVEKLLAVDVAVFGTRGVEAFRPDVDLGDSVQDSPLALAQTADFLRRARAASTETLVGLTHPDWDEERVRLEARAIAAEEGVEDPLGVVPAGGVVDVPEGETIP